MEITGIFLNGKQKEIYKNSYLTPSESIKSNACDIISNSFMINSARCISVKQPFKIITFVFEVKICYYN